jgi:nucleotide-binding universal stress UspA family protein
MNKIMFATDFPERSDRTRRRAVILAPARDAVWRFLGSVAQQVSKDAQCDVLPDAA